MMNNLKKRRKLLAVLVVLVISFVIVPVAMAWPFSDVPVGYWAYNQIRRFSNLNITSGCGGGNFCPGNYVTRAQMAVFVTNLTTAWTDANEPYIFSVDHKYPTGMHPAIVSQSKSGDGIIGTSYGASFADSGVYGGTNSTHTYDSGVSGNNTGTGAGVYGHGSATNTGYGVRAAAPASHAIYGDSNSSSTSHYGGYFRGPQGLFATSEVNNSSAISGLCSQGGVCFGINGYSTSHYGIIGSTGRADNNYGIHTPDNFYSNNIHTSVGLALIAQNGSSETLEVGDLVTAVGITEQVTGSNAPLMLVERVTTANATGVIGVVQTAYKVEMVSYPEVEFTETEFKDPEGGASDTLYISETVEREFPMQEAVDGPVAPGGLMLIQVQGLAQVKADASFGAIQAGDLLTVGDTTSIKAAPLLVEDGATALYQGGSLIGKALETLSDGKGLIWVLFDIR